MCTPFYRVGRSVEGLPGQPLRDRIRDLNVVQIRHQEVRIAGDASLGQVDQRCVAAIAVDGIDP
jgi:hypothetical protein